MARAEGSAFRYVSRCGQMAIMNTRGQISDALRKPLILVAFAFLLVAPGLKGQSTVSMVITTDYNPIFGFLEVENYAVNGVNLSGWGPTATFFVWVFSPQQTFAGIGNGSLHNIADQPLVFFDPVDPGNYDVLISANANIHLYMDLPAATAFADWNTPKGAETPIPSSTGAVSDTLTYAQTGAEVGMFGGDDKGIAYGIYSPVDISIVGPNTVPEPPVGALLISSIAAMGLARRRLKARSV